MIQIKGLCKEFNPLTKLYFSDYTFETGKSYVIVGPSGCGKSTLLNLLAGIISPTDGDIRYFVRLRIPMIVHHIRTDGSAYSTETVPEADTNLSKLSQGDRDDFRFKHIGYIFQDHKLIEDFTVLDNLEVLNINGKRYASSDFADILGKVQLSNKAKQKVKTLSGGEKQRVAIARALLNKDCLAILADEPTGSLNSDLSHEIVELLTTLCKEQNKTVIMVTHDLELTKYFDVVLNVNDILAHQPPVSSTATADKEDINV